VPRKPRCINGHELTDANIYRYRGRRMCAPCRADRRVRAAEARRTAKAAEPVTATVPTLKLKGPWRPTGWRFRAACLAVDPDLFFPALGESTAGAKAVCAACPVQEACLRFALSVPASLDLHGVIGGLSVKERQVARRAGQVAA
jgi:hypothetical protein